MGRVKELRLFARSIKKYVGICGNMSFNTETYNLSVPSDIAVNTMEEALSIATTFQERDKTIIIDRRKRGIILTSGAGTVIVIHIGTKEGVKYDVDLTKEEPESD